MTTWERHRNALVAVLFFYLIYYTQFFKKSQSCIQYTVSLYLYFPFYYTLNFNKSQDCILYTIAFVEFQLCLTCLFSDPKSCLSTRHWYTNPSISPKSCIQAGVAKIFWRSWAAVNFGGAANSVPFFSRI